MEMEYPVVWSVDLKVVGRQLPGGKVPLFPCVGCYPVLPGTGNTTGDEVYKVSLFSCQKKQIIS